LWAVFGGDGEFAPRLAELVDERMLDHAERWGAAIRLAQRFSGGTEKLLSRTVARLEEGAVVLKLKSADRALYSDAAARRHRQLASMMRREARVEIS
jgi:exopolyphosphatase/guanosine-5'-triphosphate,3'-diphosphate pyrophosphatase